MTPLLALRNVTVRFGGVTALDGVSFEVPAGQIVGLIGPNGAGKTTLFNLVTGLVRLVSGAVILRGSPIAGLPPFRIASLGISRTFQTPRVFRGLSVTRNIEAGLHTQTRAEFVDAIIDTRRAARERQEVRARVRELLVVVGLEEKAEEQAGDLTLGELRRLEIARALAAHPTLLLLDEPVAGMDRGDLRDIDTMIRKVASLGVTLFIIEHNMPVLMRLASHVIVLDHGMKIAEGAPEAVQRDPRVIGAYLGSTEPVERQPGSSRGNH